MYLSAFAFRAVAALLIVAVLGVVRYRPWISPCDTCIDPNKPAHTVTVQRPSLVVGYLPVT